MIPMPVDKPILEIKGCTCISEDVKRLYGDMVRSHNREIHAQLKSIRHEIKHSVNRRFTEELLDQEAKWKLDQELMENLQDFLEDLPTCFEFHHGERKRPYDLKQEQLDRARRPAKRVLGPGERAAYEICPVCGGELFDGRPHNHRDDNVGNIPYSERPRHDY